MIPQELEMRQRGSWDPFAPESWASLLGLIHVPLFGAERPPVPGKHAVLLDGTQGSFIMTAGNAPDLRKRAVEWTWSANMRHALVVHRTDRRIYVSGWNSRSVQDSFDIPVTGEDASRIFAKLQSDATVKHRSVISWVMQGFRQIRRIVEDPVTSLLILNGLLLVAREIVKEEIDDSKLREAKTFKDAINLLPDKLRSAAGLGGLATRPIDYPMAGVNTFFLEPDPVTGHRLLADLLFRHAASDLYQEAHLELERDRQGYLFPVESLQAPDIRTGPRDVRYAPTNLARALAEQALLRQGALSSSLVVLDPACGSGIFLQEIARELASTHNDTIKKLHLFGIDTSEIAKSITESCLHLTKIDLAPNFSMNWKIEQVDGLSANWPECDLILMNPPFRTWRDMDKVERDKVRQCLGDHFYGRPDIAQAFLWKGVQSLKPGACLAAVLPAALLDSQSGRLLREAIIATTDLLFIGRFEGFTYFSSSLVETSFVILKRRTEHPCPTLDVLIAAEGLEDAALRSLRGASTTEEVELFKIPASSLSAHSWLPRRQKDLNVLELLDQLNLTTCGDLFAIHQGIRTGNNDAFVLTCNDWSKLPMKERTYFRRAAGQGTIQEGQLAEREYVFYPYTPGGVILEDLQEVQRKLRRYYQNWLEPRRSELEKRAGVREWWLPTRPRGWQYKRSRKLVSTYFGKPGSFAYDEQGDYVVLQGFAWFWKETLIVISDKEERSFDETLYPFAYLALFNSDIFERVISCFSWRVQGGQFSLEPKFLSKVPLPDLTDDSVASRSAVGRLEELGRSIHAGRLRDVRNDINRATASVYRIPINL